MSEYWIGHVEAVTDENGEKYTRLIPDRKMTRDDERRVRAKRKAAGVEDPAGVDAIIFVRM